MHSDRHGDYGHNCWDDCEVYAMTVQELADWTENAVMMPTLRHGMRRLLAQRSALLEALEQILSGNIIQNRDAAKARAAIAQAKGENNG